MSAGAGIGWADGLNTPQEDLPDLGSPANAAVSLEDEYQAGLGWFRQMGQSGSVLEDPEVSDYIQQIGHSLSSRAEEGQHQFYYFVVRDPVDQCLRDAGGIRRHQQRLDPGDAQRERARRRAWPTKPRTSPSAT